MNTEALLREALQRLIDAIDANARDYTGEVSDEAWDQIMSALTHQYEEALANARAALAHPPQEPAPTEHVSMPTYWSVDVNIDGENLVSIGHDWLSGTRALEQADERYILGAAQHLLAFIGYRLPRSNLDPDAPALLDEADARRSARDVLAERQRQIEKEGWTPEHDDEHAGGEMAEAAACYATAMRETPMPMDWPWDPKWWKPKDYRRNLVRAGALILAEIERIDRAAISQEPR